MPILVSLVPRPTRRRCVVCMRTRWTRPRRRWRSSKGSSMTPTPREPALRPRVVRNRILQSNIETDYTDKYLFLYCRPQSNIKPSRATAEFLLRYSTLKSKKARKRTWGKRYQESGDVYGLYTSKGHDTEMVFDCILKMTTLSNIKLIYITFGYPKIIDKSMRPKQKVFCCPNPYGADGVTVPSLTAIFSLCSRAGQEAGGTGSPGLPAPAHQELLLPECWGTQETAGGGE